ncbi:MAG: 50S ribosomal protein L3 [Deltaproteobacteria bacterium]|nr:50S ribosomal protein L3 [Deltaproteobacteria bacterium]
MTEESLQSGESFNGCSTKEQGEETVWHESKFLLREVYCRKLGCSRVFDDEGIEHPVTILKLEDCFIVGVRDVEKDGYMAIQIGLYPKPMAKLSKPERGFLSKAGRGGFSLVRELRLLEAGDDKVVSNSLQLLRSNKGEVLGKKIVVPFWLKEGIWIDAIGYSKGRGFTGVLKRHNMSGPPATRGTHEARRNVGSIGCRKYPGKVFKGKRMAGRYGNERVTVLNLSIVKVLDGGKYIAVKGSVPGHKGALLKLRPAIKKKLPQVEA